MGWEDRVGVIDEGYMADLVVVDGDPLDVHGLRHRLTQIWKGGELVG